MVNPLKLIETLVEIGLTTATSPEQIPLMRLCICKTISFTETSDEFGVTLENFVKKLTVVNVIAALLSSMVSIGRSWRSIHQQLRLINILEIHVFIDTSLHFILVTLSILE